MIIETRLLSFFYFVIKKKNSFLCFYVRVKSLTYLLSPIKLNLIMRKKAEEGPLAAKFLRIYLPGSKLPVGLTSLSNHALVT